MARELSRRGYDLIITARRRDRLEELADRRRRDSRQRERLLWAAALSGAGLFIILLI